MKNFVLPTILVAFSLLCLPNKNFAQYLNLGYMENCTLFSVNGAVTNYGVSTYNGIIAADVGGVVGFDANSASYTTHYNDAFTNQATVDVLNAYILLNSVPVTVTNHAAAFSGVITPGTYLIGGAGSINGDILDGGGDNKAVFIFKFQGAFTAATASRILLTGGTRAANVFWIAEGAISTGTGCTIVGTFIAHPGAVTIGDGGSLVGRMLSTTGAVSFSGGNAELPIGASTIPIDCVVTCDNPILGSAANFTLFTSNGELSNVGTSGIIGDVGTNGGGTISGFDASTKTIVIGNKQAINSVTQQAATDLLAGYNTIKNTTTTAVHGGAFGGAGETLYAGVYATAAAGSLNGTLTLDGQNNLNSTFIFKIGGAFSVAAQSRVILKDGARRCNIFWIAEGAIDMATFTFMKGNIIAHEGAISMGGQGFLEGRMFSTNGACSFNTATTYISNSLCAGSMDNNLRVLPIQLTSFTGICYKQNIVLKWTTTSESNNKFITVERSNDGNNWEIVKSIAGAGNSYVTLNYSLVDNFPSAIKTFFYRLKQTDFDAHYKYSKVIAVANCGANDGDNLSVSPNPSTGQFNFIFTGDKSQVSSTEIFNANGEKVYHLNGFQANINMAHHAAGIYLVRLHFNDKIIVRKIVVIK